MKLELDIQTMQNQSSSHNSANENNGSEEVKKLLRAGINSAKEGNRSEARLMLLQVTEVDPQNESAWLWLASISEYPEELLVFLQNVLKINPENERAIEWAKQTKALLSKTFVQRGIDASHQLQKDFAKQCFLQAIVHDEQNEMAWLWLASSTDSVEEKCSHLQKVLNINPENETALSSMKSVKNQIAQPYLKKASSAAISGDHELARQNVDEAMKYAPELEEVWVLKAFLASDFYDKIACYEKALQINPNHDGAKAGLASLRALAPKIAEVIVPVEEKNEEVAAQTENNADVAEPPQIENEIEESVELDNLLETPTDETVEQLQEPTELLSEVFDAPTGDLDDSYAQNAQAVFAPKEDIESQAPVEEIETQAPATDLFNEVQKEEVIVEEENHTQFSAEEIAAEESQLVEQFNTEANTQATKDFSLVQEFTYEPQNQVELNEGTNSEVAEEVQKISQTESTESVDVAEFQSVESFDVPESQAEIQTAEETVTVEESAQTEETQPATEPQYFAPTQEIAEPESVIEESQQSEPQQFTETVTYEPQYNSSNGFGTHPQADVYVDHQQPTVEFSYQNVPTYTESVVETDQNVPAYTEPVAEPVTTYVPQEVAAPQSDYVQQEAPQTEPEVEQIEELKEEVTEEIHQTYSTAEPIQCPFCNAQNEHQAVACVSCQAMLSLSDLEMLLAHQNANQEVILRAIEKMEVEKTIRDFDLDELKTLGIAHLNAHNLRKGFTYLQEASQLNPNDVVLSSKVNFLAIRLSEIEEYDQKAQDNPVQSRTILVVDDSPTVRKLISGKLEKCGHSVVSAVDGMDALAKINEVIPDLVLLDITMPRLDGYQVCKLIRNNDITKDIPVVMISGKDGFFDKVRGRMAGSSGYITKPFGPDTLMKTIETYLS